MNCKGCNESRILLSNDCHFCNLILLSAFTINGSANWYAVSRDYNNLNNYFNCIVMEFYETMS